jgi:uncharacterized protein (TIGR03435 family)
MIDRTALEGLFNFHLTWTPVPLPSSLASLDGLPEGSLIPAIQDHLGLIERAERPIEN